MGLCEAPTPDKAFGLDRERESLEEDASAQNHILNQMSYNCYSLAAWAAGYLGGYIKLLHA